MRSLLLLAAAAGLVAVVACGSKVPGTTSSGGGNGHGGGASVTSASSGSGGATSSAGGTGGATTTTASAGTGGATTTTASSTGTGGSPTTSASSSSGAPTCTGTQVLCGASCTDLTADAHACGACGHDCLGAACSAGLCAPTDVVVGGPVTLVAVDPLRVFYTAPYDINAVPLAGGASQKINMQVGSLAFGAGAFVLDNGSVYWTSGFSPGSGFVLTASKSGGGQKELVDNLAPYGQPFALATDSVDPNGAAHAVVWCAHGDGMSTGAAIVKTSFSFSGSTSTLLGYAPVKFLIGLAVDPTSAYVISPDGGNVFKVPLAGGTPVVFSAGITAPTYIVADATNLYVVDLGIFSGSTAPAGKIIKIPLDGSPAVTLATNLANLAGITVGGGNVYVTSRFQTSSATADGAVLSVPIGGGAPVTIASGQPSPGGIAVDGTYVYWADYGVGAASGGVRKAPR